ncbi:unnamed protein product, partial [Symbiodinium necroappetens]
SAASSSSPAIVTPPPRTQAKQRKQHYLVKDRSYGYLCVLCGGNSQDIRELKARQCFALPDLQPLDARLETASKSSGRASKAGSPPRDAGPKGCLTPTEAESEVTPEQAMMLEELASLQKQQALLEELLQLQELKDYEKALQEEEEFFEQALRRSALEAEEQELTKRKRSVEAEKRAEVAPTKIPKKTPVNDELPAAIPGESTAAEAYEAGEAPHAIVESAKAEPREAKEAPQAIVESAKAESREAKEAPQAIVESAKAESREAEEASAAILESAKAESREAEEAPAAILESAKAESREAEEAPTAILESAKAESREAEEAPVIRSVKPVGVVCYLVAMLQMPGHYPASSIGGPDLVDTLPQELCFDEPCMEAPLEDGMGADLLGTCRRLQVPVEKDMKGKDEQASSVSLRIAPESDCDEDGEEEPLEDDVVLDVKDGKLGEAAKASEVPAKAVSPSKATVFYEHTLPPCPVEMDHKPTTPAEQREALGLKTGRGRGGRGGRGRGRGAPKPGRGRGRGRACKEEEEQEDEEQEDEQSEDEPSIGPNHETDDEDDGKCGKGPKVTAKAKGKCKAKAKPAPKAKATPKTKASPKAKAKAKATPKAKSKPEEKEQKAGKRGRKAKEEEQEVPIPSAARYSCVTNSMEGLQMSEGWAVRASSIYRKPEPRIYTEIFAKNLLKAFQEWCKLPPAHRADIRARRSVNLDNSDKEIFASLPTGDLWLDARVHETFLYLYGSKNCVIPDSWVGVMESFKDDVVQKACGDERLRSELQELQVCSEA